MPREVEPPPDIGLAYDYRVLREGIIQCGHCGHASNRIERLQHADGCPRANDLGESG